jgi:hypothetical protein
MAGARNTTNVLPKIEESEWKKRRIAVLAALENGARSYRTIAATSGLTLGVVQSVMRKYDDIHVQYVAKLQQIKNLASANMSDIIADKDHPKNFEATKYFMTKYVTEYDEAFESKEGSGDFKIDVGGKQAQGGVNITFTSQKEDK